METLIVKIVLWIVVVSMVLLLMRAAKVGRIPALRPPGVYYKSKDGRVNMHKEPILFWFNCAVIFLIASIALGIIFEVKFSISNVGADVVEALSLN